MSSENSLEILKSAILLEKRGQAFYTQVAENTSSGPVREFFQQMADEERAHIQALSQQYRSYCERQKFDSCQLADGGSDRTAAEVLTQKLQGEISAASYEAAAISAAIAMEQKAVDLYSRRAESAPDPEEAALYRWLAQWERGHLSFLADLDRQLTETVWFDNSFWPM